MNKKFLALLLALTTAFSAITFGGCEFSLNFGSDSYEESDTDGGDTETGGSGNSDSTGGNGGSDSTGGEDGCAEHTDENSDGACDVCENSVMRSLDIFAINDLHGKVLDGDGHIGVDELTTYFKQTKAQNPDTIFLSSGDMWQGADLSNLTKGMLVTDWMNELGFASMTLGNHEYDWGETDIQTNADAANFPFLAINIYKNSTNERVDYCDASVLYETDGGVKVGIIGAMGDCYSSISADKVQDVHFKTGSALTGAVKSEANKLRAAGADVIVYSVHDDYSAYDVAISQYVDIVFEGHSHSSYAKKDGAGVWHLQGGGDNDGITRAQISVNIANETHSVTTAQTVSSSTYSHYAKDPIIETLSKKYNALLEEATRVVGYNEKLRNSDEICDTVAQLYYELGQQSWGDKYDIVLGGAFLSTRAPYDIQMGDVTYGDLLNVLPFDNQIVLCSIKGSNLTKGFINNARYHNYFADGFTADSIDSTKTYYVVTDTYSSTYSYNQCTELERYDDTTFARDLLADYIGTGAWGTKKEMVLTPISELLEIGATLGKGEKTSEAYYVKGTVSRITNTTYGNIYITDGNGNEFYLYGLYDLNGTRFDSMARKPVVGDEIIVHGTLFNYQGTTLEFSPATLISFADEDSTGGGNTSGGNTSGGTVTTEDPYENVSKTEFYMNYTPASDYMDAYYRSLHGLMSGGIETPDQEPTLAKNQPKKDGKFVRNTAFRFADDGKTYIVVDAAGQEAFRVYKDGAYITLEEVAAYVYAFGTYPQNYTTSKKTSPSDSVWGEYLRVNHTQFSGSTTKYPYEPELPNITGCGGSLQYYEMDIGTTGTDCDPSYTAELYNNGSSITRGAARIVYGKKDLNGNGTYDVGELYVFYTYNHYNDFQEYLNYQGGWGEMFGNITGGGTISSKYDYNPTAYVDVYWGVL